MALKKWMMVPKLGAGRRRVPVRRDDGASPFWPLQQEMNRLFDDFFRGWGSDLAPFRAFEEGLSAFAPRIDMTEDEKAVQIAAELPGVDEKDVEISVSGDILTIRGEKKAEREDKGRNYYRMERSYGSFHRAIPLPVGVDQDKVEASFKKGVLSITLPKTAEAQRQAKKITVKAE
jgi:HSP20 family protein